MACAHVVGAGAARTLDGDWALAGARPGCAATPADLEASSAPSWIPCDGAMPVAAALRAAGLWNVSTLAIFDSEDWWYRCRFSAADAAAPARLRFEGLATVADAWLNGEHILHSENMFVAHDVDVPLVAGQNELVLRFGACSPLERQGARARDGEQLSSNARTCAGSGPSLLGRIPGWCPANSSGRAVETDLPGSAARSKSNAPTSTLGSRATPAFSTSTSSSVIVRGRSRP